MTEIEYELVGKGYSRVRDLPRDYHLFHRCTLCKTVVPSMPDEDLSRCDCGNISFDFDYARSGIVNVKEVEVVRQRIKKQD